MDFSHILKHNPFHDALGRFTTSDMATFVTIWRKGGTSLTAVPAAQPVNYKNIGDSTGNDVRPIEYTHMDKAAKAYMDKLPKAQHQAVIAYTGSAYHEINGSLRGHEKATLATKALIEDMDKAIAGHKFGVDAQVYRGVSDTFSKKLMALHAKGDLLGKVLLEPGYSSATVDQKMGASWGYDGVMYKINVPRDQPALYVGGEYGNSTYSKFPHENELILPRDTTMTVVHVDDSKTIAGPKLVVTVNIQSKTH